MLTRNKLRNKSSDGVTSFKSNEKMLPMKSSIKFEKNIIEKSEICNPAREMRSLRRASRNDYLWNQFAKNTLKSEQRALQIAILASLNQTNNCKNSNNIEKKSNNNSELNKIENSNTKSEIIALIQRQKLRNNSKVDQNNVPLSNTFSLISELDSKNRFNIYDSNEIETDDFMKFICLRGVDTNLPRKAQSKYNQSIDSIKSNNNYTINCGSNKNYGLSSKKTLEELNIRRSPRLNKLNGRRLMRKRKL